jgi:glycerophosphoryl diester phosphodiesterase
MYLVGHRGTCSGAPENTMAAFRLAVEAGVDGVELDVQWTRASAAEPSRMVLVHDWTLDRTTDGSGLVTDHTWSDLARLDAGSWYGPGWAGERIPLFEDALAYLATTGVAVHAELKTKAVTAEQAADYVRAVQRAGIAHRTNASAFHTAVLAQVGRAANGEIATGIIEMAHPRAAHTVRARGTWYFPVHTVITAEDVAELRDLGVRTCTWPAREEADYVRALGLGVHGVTADDPVAAVAWFRGQEAGGRTLVGAGAAAR